MQIEGTVQSHALHGDHGRLITIGTPDPAGPRIIVTVPDGIGTDLPIGAAVTIVITVETAAQG